MWNIRESVSIDRVTDAQLEADSETYYGRRVLGNSLSTYKYEMFNKKKPKVLVIGQSVSLQFRNFMFEPYQDEFYNAGLLMRNVTDLEFITDWFAEDSTIRPEYMVLALDFTFVLENATLDYLYSITDLPVDRAIETRSHLKGIQDLMLNASVRQRPNECYGYGKAGMTGRGYRIDGSYRHLPEIEAYIGDSTYRDGDLIDKLKRGEAEFKSPMNYSLGKAERVLHALHELEDQGIHLLVYVPPYSEVFFKEAMQNSDFNSFWKQFMHFQEEMINKGFDVIPFTVPSEIGLTDSYMVDAAHPGEVICGIQLMNFYHKKVEAGYRSPFSFGILNSYLNDPHTIPISFLIDPASQLLRKD